MILPLVLAADGLDALAHPVPPGALPALLGEAIDIRRPAAAVPSARIAVRPALSGGTPRGRSTMGEVKATWNGAVIAESDDTVVVENNHYFPATSVRTEYLRDSATTSVCPWKGTASYRTLVVDGAENTDAAWVYPTPKDAAAQLKDHYAFWRGVTVTG